MRRQILHQITLVDPDDDFKAAVVATILDSRPEDALGMLSRQYRVDRPRLSVGVFEGRTKRVRAVYSARKKEIRAAKREFLYDPFTILHEFYHHLRSFQGEHRGTEKGADNFAREFVEAYNRTVAELEKKRRAG